MVFDKGVRTPKVSVITAMNPTDEFLRHAADCQQMAKFTRDPASKATWSRMAERWLQCAERFRSGVWDDCHRRDRRGRSSVRSARFALSSGR
jgi:hypothetical protein